MLENAFMMGWGVGSGSDKVHSSEVIEIVAMSNTKLAMAFHVVLGVVIHCESAATQHQSYDWEMQRQ